MIRGADDGQLFVVRDYTEDEAENILEDFFSNIKRIWRTCIWRRHSSVGNKWNTSLWTTNHQNKISLCLMFKCENNVPNWLKVHYTDIVVYLSDFHKHSYLSLWYSDGAGVPNLSMHWIFLDHHLGNMKTHTELHLKYFICFKIYIGLQIQKIKSLVEF